MANGNNNCQENSSFDWLTQGNLGKKGGRKEEVWYILWSFDSPEAISSIMTENWKDIHLQMGIFLPFEWVNSIEIALQTCNIFTDRFFSYMYVIQFQLNLPPQMAKSCHICKFKKLNIFSHFNICHGRRKGFLLSTLLQWLGNQ